MGRLFMEKEMSHQYKVVKDCFFGGVYRTPDNKHNIVTVDDKFEENEQPHALEYAGELGEAVAEPEPEPEPKDRNVTSVQAYINKIDGEEKVSTKPEIKPKRRRRRAKK
ncbi:MAG: hypothetical protein COB23_03180 [Methylophaga sp.]|nr:MAG: hypothetical protein COB23_03180 [Methylophaga sp.]